MKWIEVVELIERMVDAFGPVGDSVGDFLLTTAEHLWKRHAIDIEKGEKLGKIGEWLLSSAMCGVRRVIAGQGHCPDNHRVSEGHGLPIPE